MTRINIIIIIIKKNLVHYILDRINYEIENKPVFQEVPPEQKVVRRLVVIPAQPIIRRQVLYRQDEKKQNPN